MNIKKNNYEYWKMIVNIYIFAIFTNGDLKTLMLAMDVCK